MMVGRMGLLRMSQWTNSAEHGGRRILREKFGRRGWSSCAAIGGRVTGKEFLFFFFSFLGSGKLLSCSSQEVRRGREREVRRWVTRPGGETKPEFGQIGGGGACGGKKKVVVYSQTQRAVGQCALTRYNKHLVNQLPVR